MKKTLISIVCLLTITGWSSAQAADGSFSDLDRSSPNFGAIEFLKEAGIIKGYQDGTFKPRQSINRAEALKIILLSKEYLGQKVVATEIKDLVFPDVNSTDWFYNYVRLAFNAKIVDGYPDGTFKPAQEVNAAESLKMAILTFETQFKVYAPTEDPYLDVKKDDWFASYVDYAKQSQLIEAYGDYKYLPSRQMSRGEFAELVFRLIYLKKNNVSKFPLSLNWNYCNNYQAGYKIKYPFSWQKFVTGEQLLIWKQDVGNNQISFARVFPNSATVVVVNDKNLLRLSLEQYIKLIDYGAGAEIEYLTLNGLQYASVYVKATGLQDSYFSMPNGNILVVYSQVGGGPMAVQLKEEIRYMLGSIRESNQKSTLALENCFDPIIVEPAVSEVTAKEKILSELNSHVLVEGAGKTAIDTLGDAYILLTDTIGIGTGPVDYYYSPTYSMTVKLDRNSDTILAIKNEKTTSF
jgi:hypothetical protein